MGKERPYIKSLNSIRALGSILVICCHTVELNHTRIGSCMANLIPYFNFAVPFLYVLSGFIISYTYANFSFSRDSILNYYLRRFFRIGPLFYFMLLVIYCFLKILNPNFSFSLSDLLINVTFTFGLVPGKNESLVWAGWSVGVEVIFYIIFPLILVVHHSKTFCFISMVFSFYISKLVFSSFLSLGSFAHTNILNQMPFFIAGIFAYRVWEEDNFKISVSKGVSFYCSALILGLCLWYLPFTNHNFSVQGINGLLWGLTFTSLILALCYWPHRLSTNRVVYFLGNISYSLYLIHVLVISILSVLGTYNIISRNFENDNIINMFSIILTLCISILFATLTYNFIEITGIKFGKNFINGKYKKFDFRFKLKSLKKITQY